MSSHCLIQIRIYRCRSSLPQCSCRWLSKGRPGYSGIHSHLWLRIHQRSNKWVQSMLPSCQADIWSAMGYFLGSWHLVYHSLTHQLMRAFQVLIPQNYIFTGGQGNKLPHMERIANRCNIRSQIEAKRRRGWQRRGWHRMKWLDGITELKGHEFEQTQGVSDGQGREA